MALVHVKLNNGEDILAHGKILEDGKKVKLRDPIVLHFDPETGVYARHWMIFSKENSVTLPSNQFIFIANASEGAIEYYNSFNTKSIEKQRNELTESDEELEEIYNSILESQISTKH